ncbi:kelch repeat and BTB domain-containing protein 2-like [Branchiostoma lanceolatum]|uniref:kelch repeat and BTB domain-containing protein 2-like n=1 Tax=Branchiostoma lanceolatum TaxID=7740 RepID=UPI0034527237
MFGEILSYIYSGTLHVSLDKVQPLYQAADFLQLDYVRDTCSSYMVLNVERSTCVDLYKFADVFSVGSVLKACLECIYRNFAEVASSDEFCSLSVNQLTEIISHDELDVKEETTVWEAVVRWVQHSRDDRLHHLPSILHHIRFNLLTSDDTTAILEHPLVREDPGSSEVIRNVIKKGNSNLKARLGVTMEMVMLSRKDLGPKELLFMNPREGKYISCSYKTKDLPDFPTMVVTSDNDIYMLGTKELKDKNKYSLFKYNHAENVWEHVGTSSISKGPGDDMKYFYDRLVEVDQNLYHIVVDRHKTLVRMRKYNWHTGQWQECAQLQLEDSLYHSAALSCSSHIYFLTNDEVYRYDPRQDRWCKRTAPKIHFSEVYTAVAMGTEIYCTDMDFRQTMVYDTKSDCWQKRRGWPLPPDTQGFVSDFCPSLFVLENQLHILMNYTSDGALQPEDIYVVYVYDRSADAWRDLKVTLPNDKGYMVYGCQYRVARMHLQYLKGA